MEKEIAIFKTDKEDTKKPLVSETVNFVKPSVENAQKTNSKNETRKELSFPKNTIPVKETVVE